MRIELGVAVPDTGRRATSTASDCAPLAPSLSVTVSETVYEPIAR